jgi:tRNA1(Val) A37 N6-methylase TrmN6
MLQYVTLKAGRILEVGCASGLFGQLLKTERSVEVWGVELNDSAAEMAAQRLDRVNLLNGFSLRILRICAISSLLL